GARGGPEVDLHAWSLHMEPGPAGDEGLWARARAAALRGRPVRVPAPVDMALIALMHGPVADIDAPADWAVDAADALADPNMDWETLVAEAQRRRLGAALNWGLSYLDHIEAVTLPGGLLAALRAGADTAQERELAAWLKPKARWTPADRLSTERMKRARPRGALPRPGPRTRLRDTALFRAGSGTKGSEGLVELVFDSPPRDRARLSFDLVDADGWLARLRLTVNALDRLSGRRRWRFALPRALRGTPRIVALDGSGQPVTRHGVRLVASAASGPGLACETVSNETVEAKG
ncbi:MAG: nucleotidyltransferase family protein, partial [Rubricella sp.]